MTVDDPLHTEAGYVREVFRRGQRAEPRRRALGDGTGDRMLGGVLQRACQPQDFGLVGAVGGAHGQQGHAPGGDGAGLVEDDGVDPARGLQYLRALDQDAQLGAASGADQQRGRRGQPQGAGAGDDQYGDGGGERGREPGAVAEPEAEGAQGEGDHDRHEDGGDPVREPLRRGLAVLRVLHQLRHPGQLGVGADPRGLDDETSARVDGGAGDRVASTTTSTGTDSPVSMDASTADEPSTTVPSVAIFSPGRTRKRSCGLQLGHGDGPFTAVPSEHGDVLRPQFQQCP